MEDDDDYDDDEDDYDDERNNNAKQQEDAEVKERLEKLSRYEAAVAQINKLSDQLTGPPKSRGRAAASKTDGTGRAAAPKADDGSNAGPKSSRPETVKNRAASPKVSKEKSVVVSAEASSSEKPKRARAPKTRFTNPLTGSVVENRNFFTVPFSTYEKLRFRLRLLTSYHRVPVPTPYLLQTIKSQFKTNFCDKSCLFT
jgi:hypothetical protein